jgi:hypothetical protein
MSSNDGLYQDLGSGQWAENVQLTGSNVKLDGASLPIIPLMLYNGNTYDLQRGNMQGTLLASSTRTVSVTAANMTNHNSGGVILTLDVTANPGGTETLTLIIRHVDPVTGKITPGAATFPIPAATNGLFRLFVYPGASVNDTNNKFGSVPVGKTWTASVSHSSTGSWTYSLGYDLVL